MIQNLQESKVDRAVILVTNHLSIEGYQFPGGEIRYSVNGVCELFGLDVDTLTKSGFDGEVVEGLLTRQGETPSIVPTLSRSDVLAIGIFAAGHLQRVKARALLAASLAEMLEGCTREAFGLPAMSIEERLALFESESDRASITDARATLDEMNTDDRAAAPFDSAWSLRGIFGPFLVHENPWD